MDITALSHQAEAELSPVFRRMDDIALQNTARVLAAFQEERVSAATFAGTTGYGYDDLGRETLERIFA
ncbi:MAG: methionine gamma-lyase family protein, partial [bacterium]